MIQDNIIFYNIISTDYMQYHTTISTILYHMIQYIRGVIEESSLDPLSQIQLKRDDAAPAIYICYFSNLKALGYHPHYIPISFHLLALFY